MAADHVIRVHICTILVDRFYLLIIDPKIHLIVHALRVIRPTVPFLDIGLDPKYWMYKDEPSSCQLLKFERSAFIIFIELLKSFHELPAYLSDGPLFLHLENFGMGKVQKHGIRESSQPLWILKLIILQHLNIAFRIVWNLIQVSIQIDWIWVGVNGCHINQIVPLFVKHLRSDIVFLIKYP